MGTRSRIGIENSDGTITSIYCHWDGYLSNNGRMLLEAYSDVEKINELLKLGDLSSLECSPDSCVAYGRDRGESDVGCRVSDNVDEFVNLFEEYNYLYRDGEWWYRKSYNDDGWHVLAMSDLSND